MNQLKLSVVLCTYNGEGHLREQLSSLLGQTRRPDEILIGDDGSTDTTWSILQAFLPSAQAFGITVRTIRQERNVGFVCNFSKTLRQASADLLFLCDQDDVWKPEKLALMEARFIADPRLLMLCSDARLVDENGLGLGTTLFDALELEPAELRAVHDGRAFDVLLRRSMVTGATSALRREVLDVGLPVGAGWIHDEWLAIVLSAVGVIDVIEQPFIDYRQHAKNQVGMRKRTLVDKWRDLIRPRRAQFETEILRLASLEAHLMTLGERVAPDRLSRVRHKRRHFLHRVQLGRRPRLLRLPAVLRELRTGNYRRYGTGLRSVLRDMLRHD